MLVTATLVTNACFGPATDTSLYVRNDTDRAWYINVPVDLEKYGKDYDRVVRVDPGVDDAWTVSWAGGREITVSVLDDDCSVVGTFRLGGDAYVVDAVPGLTGRMEDHGQRLGPAADGIQFTTDCSGDMEA